MRMVLLIILLAVSAAAQPPDAAYGLNASSGTVASDSAGTNHGTLTNGPTWVIGKYDNGVQFDGVDDFISVPDAAAVDIPGAGTIEAWVKLSAINRWNSVIAKGNANDNNVHNYALEVNNGNKWMCILGSGTAARTVTSVASAAVGVWTHVACRWDGATLQVYINGVSNASVAQSLTLGVNTSPLWIGQFGGNADRLAGVIDEVRVYKRALSVAEIQSDMNTPVVAPPPPAGTKIEGGKFEGAGFGVAGSPPPPVSHSVDLTWTASVTPDVTGYRIYRRLLGGTLELLATVGNVTAYNDATVANGTTYVYAVTAVSPSGESVFSNEVTAVIP